MALPSVNISVKDGNLGRKVTRNKEYLIVTVDDFSTSPTTNFIATYEDLRSLADFVEKTDFATREDWIGADTISNVYEQVRDFYEEAGDGTILHVMQINVAAMASISTNFLAGSETIVEEFLRRKQGRVEFVGIEMLNTADNPYDWGELPTRVLLFAQIAQKEFLAQRPVQFVLGPKGIYKEAMVTNSVKAASASVLDVEGYKFVSVFSGRNQQHFRLVQSVGMEVGTDESLLISPTLIQVGKVLGKIAATPIHQNIAQVTNDNLQEIPIRNLPVQEARVASNLASIPNSQKQRAFHENGYIFYRTHVGFDGVFLNDSTTCSYEGSDFSRIERVRVINEVCRIAYKEYMRLALLKTIVLTPEGNIAPLALKNLEQSVKTKIESDLAGSIVSADVFVDPDQDVLATDALNVALSVVPFGLGSQINITVAYSNPNQ